MDATATPRVAPHPFLVRQGRDTHTHGWSCFEQWCAVARVLQAGVEGPSPLFAMPWNLCEDMTSSGAPGLDRLLRGRRGTAAVMAPHPPFLLREAWSGEILENQQEITTLTVIWARQLVSPQLGPVP